ncbi:MAG: polyprenyl synthetase family protein [Planctomycetes bacterium]|nr:polyprenyl synthetase family protein [Planctomycetota bacterium]
MATGGAPVHSDLPDVLEPLRGDLEAVGRAYARILESRAPHVAEMVAHAARFTGKRLRPALACLAARVVRGDIVPDVATVAAIVELIHTATLVHDDVLDGAMVRRRVATLNALWGDDTAVLLGDVLFSRAYLAAARLDDRFASVYLSEVVGEVLEGEIRQNRERHNLDLDETAYRSVIRGKTAALYEAALVVGAHYAGGDRETVRALAAYGHHLGMAFQIVDDRLDLAGDEATVGKSLGVDLREGKVTLPVIVWLRSRPSSERSEARALVEAAGRDDAAQERLVRHLRADGALAAADTAARDEAEAAQKALESVPAGAARDLLRLLAEYVIRRSL